jgi:hypothetical protein
MPKNLYEHPEFTLDKHEAERRNSSSAMRQMQRSPS